MLGIKQGSVGRLLVIEDVVLLVYTPESTKLVREQSKSSWEFLWLDLKNIHRNMNVNMLNRNNV